VYTGKHMPKRVSSVDWLTIKHFWSASTKYKRQLAIGLLVPVSALGISIVVPYYIGKILGSLAHPGTDIRGYIYVLSIASIASVVLNYVAFKSLFAMQPKVMADLQEEVLEALLKRGTSFHNNRVSGKLVSDAIDYPTAYIQLSNVFLLDIVSFLAVILLGVILVSLHSLLIGFILFLMAAMAIGSALWFRHRMAPFRRIRHDANKAVTAHISDAIVNNTTVKTFGSEPAELKRHRTLAATLLGARTHDWDKVAVDGSYRNFALLLFQTVFVLIVVNEVHHNPALLATGIFAFSYTITISNRLFQVGTMMRTVEDSLQLAMPTTEMLQETPEILDKPDAKDLTVDAGGIRFQDVSFHYQDNPKNSAVFSELALTIRPGEKVGLVGPSGGGKSTLTKLLLRFEDIQGGKILIDGQDIACVTQASLRRSIAYVPQEPLLFHRTIKENIAYGRPEASDAEIEQAARLAHADVFISRLPNSYDTVVGERGVKLSGGQRQRVAIARAILKDAPILLLDEATSALDSESEVAIQAALWELMQGRTTLVVAHRLSTIQRLDRIIVLDGGNIVETGSHKELLDHNGLYAKLWNHQSGGFIEE
jgi:ATP-binding cassette subfamily B protein